MRQVSEKLCRRMGSDVGCRSENYLIKLENLEVFPFVTNRCFIAFWKELARSFISARLMRTLVGQNDKTNDSM